MVGILRGKFETETPFADDLNPKCLDSAECDTEAIRKGFNATNTRPALNLPLLRENWIDTAVVHGGDSLPIVKNGVNIGEGDGTVSLISLGAMCVEGWKRKTWNPSGIKVTTVEVSILIVFSSVIMPTQGVLYSSHISQIPRISGVVRPPPITSIS